MQQRRFRIWPALLIFGVLLTLATVAPVAVGATALSVSFGCHKWQQHHHPERQWLRAR